MSRGFGPKFTVCAWKPPARSVAQCIVAQMAMRRSKENAVLRTVSITFSALVAMPVGASNLYIECVSTSEPSSYLPGMYKVIPGDQQKLIVDLLVDGVPGGAPAFFPLEGSWVIDLKRDEMYAPEDETSKLRVERKSENAVSASRQFLGTSITLTLNRVSGVLTEKRSFRAEDTVGWNKKHGGTFPLTMSRSASCKRIDRPAI